MHSLKRRVAALAAALGIAVSALAVSARIPSVPPTAEDFPAISVIQQMPVPTTELADGILPDEDGDDTSRSWRRRLHKFARWMTGTGLSLAFRLLVLLPLTLLGRLLLWLAGRLLGGLLPFLKLFLAELLFCALMLFVVMTLLYQALYPWEKPRHYWRIRNVLFIVCVSVALAALRCGLAVVLPDSSLWLISLRALSLIAAPVWLWHKTMLPKGPFFPRLARFILRVESVAACALSGCGVYGFFRLRLWLTAGDMPLWDSLSGAAACYMLCAGWAVCIYRYARHRVSPLCSVQKKATLLSLQP